MSAKSSTEVMLYVVLTMPTLNKAYLFIYLLIQNHTVRTVPKSNRKIVEITEKAYNTTLS
jgi:hypothetical protein